MNRIIKHVKKTKKFMKICNFNEFYKCKCGQKVHINGSSSHSKMCKYSNKSKSLYLFKKYKFNKICPICKKNINLKFNIIDIRKKCLSFFCCHECFILAKKNVSKYKRNLKLQTKCKICNKKFIGDRKTCSNKCYLKLLKNKVSICWKKQKRTGYYKTRCENIGKRSYENAKAWNKGLKGEEYLKHFEKNGVNNFYNALKNNNKWFKKTYPEIKMDNLLKEMNLKYKYSFFTSNRQFDFIVSLNKNVFIIEVDGNFWHKSNTHCQNIDERLKMRQSDKEKEKVIEKIKNTDKKWYVIRFWELDVVNDIENVKKYLLNLVYLDKNGGNIENEICEIKKYYDKKS